MSYRILKPLFSLTGSLLKKFAEKNIAYRLKQNPIEKSILWKIEIPEVFYPYTNFLSKL